MKKATRWRDYCGASSKELDTAMENVLTSLGIAFRKKQESAHPAEITMLGSSKEITAYEVGTTDSFSIKIIPVTGDPFMRIWSRILTEKSLVQKATVLDIYPLTDSTKPIIREALGMVFQQLKRHPWEFSDLKFQLAVLLRLKIKRNWGRLLSGQ
ncbi:MAG TPA: hypothetical protein VNT57_02395 [Desulfobacteria bacterium]|nr:hypothetical protein [Desulfobacteria bacterium]